MSSPDSNALTLKLEHGAKLDDADKAKLVQMTRSARDVRAHIDLIREGEKPDCVRLILSGFACRYKLLDHGSRSIMGYLLPGDFCDLHVSILGEMDHNIATFSECSVVEIDNNEMDELIEASPRIARAFWWAELVEQAIQRQWLVNMARRPADQRLAHLLCELYHRLRAVGVADGNSYPLPLTQEEIADTLGMSSVHINRTIQRLRRTGYVNFQGRRVTISNVQNLADFGDFRPNYLHLCNPSRT